MNLEKFIETVLKNPDNISIEYSNINGKEKLVVNGKEFTKEEKESFDDSEIKKKIAKYKKDISYLDEWVWNLVMDEAANRNFNILEMNRILNLASYTEQEALQANNTISIMSDLIKDVLDQQIQSLVDLIERF